jgi:hypothetical protein
MYKKTIALNKSFKNSIITPNRRKKNMDPNRMNARLAGIFFITATAAPILSYFFLFSLYTPDYLVTLAANEGLVMGGLLIELIWALAVLGIPVMLFPVLKTHNEGSALGFLGLRLIEAISTIVGSIFLLSLLPLSQEFVQAGAPATSHYQTLGTVLLAAREGAHLLGSGLVWPISALILNYILYQSKLVPRWLSGWGLAGATLIFASELLQLVSINLEAFLFLPIAVQEMVFAVWLIVKGFNASAIASPT